MTAVTILTFLHVATMFGVIAVALGSAVLLPEVFLKAINIARNIDGKPTRIVTANLDMVQHYRPSQNVVQRPTLPDGTGYRITGHHGVIKLTLGDGEYRRAFLDVDGSVWDRGGRKCH